jgi:hypothetical protein
MPLGPAAIFLLQCAGGYYRAMDAALFTNSHARSANFLKDAERTAAGWRSGGGMARLIRLSYLEHLLAVPIPRIRLAAGA